jgi:TfoX/Sxy family transcriptional regulator of competence genes
MAYDEDLAGRIRELVASVDGVSEKRMFGGLAFLVNGNMAVAASGQGGVLLRVDPEDGARFVKEPGVGPMVMRGREMQGWLRIETAKVRTQRDLSTWVKRGLKYATSLPAKP